MLKLFCSFLQSTLLLLLVTPLFVSANQPISDKDMQKYIKDTYDGGNEEGAVNLAKLSVPLFHFSKESCYPGHPLDDDGYVKDAATRYNWPKADGSSCANSGGMGLNASSYPIWFTVSQCADNDIRVTYGLYFAKDGFKTILAGHGHDWEWVTMKWGKQDDGSWSRSGIWLSAHKGEQYKVWKDIDFTQNNDGSEPHPSEGTYVKENGERAKVYVGWAKHALRYTPKSKGGKTIAETIGDAEYRKPDRFYNPSFTDPAFSDRLMYVNPGTDLGDLISIQAVNPRKKEGYQGLTYPEKAYNNSCQKKEKGGH